MEQLEIQQFIKSLSVEAFDKFLSELPMNTILTIDEEMELIHLIRKGGESAERAKEMLAKSYLRFVYSVAKIYKDHSLSIQELLVSGITGLIRATAKYDETRGFKFMSYAVWWIRQNMINDIHKRDTENSGS